MVEGEVGEGGGFEDGGENVGLAPGDGIEEGGVVAAEGEEVAAVAGGGAEDGVVAVVELGEGGVDPAGGKFDAVTADGGDFFVALLEGGGEGVVELGGAGAGALGDEVDLGGVEVDVGVIDDFREDPESDAVMGLVGGEADAEEAVFQAAELAEEDADHGAVGAGCGVRGGAPGEVPQDLPGGGFVEEEEEKAHLSYRLSVIGYQGGGERENANFGGRKNVGRPGSAATCLGCLNYLKLLNSTLPLVFWLETLWGLGTVRKRRC